MSGFRAWRATGTFQRYVHKTQVRYRPSSASLSAVPAQWPQELALVVFSRREKQQQNLPELRPARQLASRAHCKVRDGRSLSSSGPAAQRNIFDGDEDEDEFRIAMQELMRDDAAGQLAGAKRLSALLKPQTLMEDVPIGVAELNAVEEERRAQLRKAWATAMLDPDSPASQAQGDTDARTHTHQSTEDDENDAALSSMLHGFGDVSFDMVAEALAAVDALGVLPYRGGVPAGGILVDFSGRGGQVGLAAALLHSFDCVLGVEASEEQCQLARQRLVSLQGTLAHVVGDDDRLTWEVSFEQAAGGGEGGEKEAAGDAGGAADRAMLAADLVTVNCVGLDDYQMNDLGEGLLGLKPNTIIISFGRRVPCPGAQLLDTRLLASQGEELGCYIMQRVQDGLNEHLMPHVHLPLCIKFPANRESGLLRRAGQDALDRLVELVGGAPPAEGAVADEQGSHERSHVAHESDVARMRHVAAMTLSYCAHSESSARQLIGEKHGIIDRLLDMLASSKAASKDGKAGVAAAAAAVILLRALAKHTCALPAIVDTPGSIEMLVALLAFDNLAVAAGAADLVGSCLLLVEARAVIAQAGAVKGLESLKSRASASKHTPALETAELVLSLLGNDSPDAVGKTSPLYEHLKGLGLDKDLPSKKF